MRIASPQDGGFAAEDKAALDDFWRVYDRHAAEIHEDGLRIRQLAPELAPLFADESARDEFRAASRRRDELARAGDWGAVERFLLEQGRVYADAGVSFEVWTMVTRSAVAIIAGHTVRAYHLEPERLIAALRVARHIFDSNLIAIGTQYIEAKEQAVREGEARYRLLVDAVQEYGIYMIDPDGVIMSWNAGAERIKGFRADEVIGKNVALFYEEAEVAAGKPAHDREIAVARGFVEYQVWQRRADGRSFRAEVAMTAIRNSGGGLVGFSRVVHDISDRKRAADTIATSAAQLRALADRLQRVQEEERTRMAREVHDEIGQQLTGLKMDIVWLRRAAEPTRTAAVAERIDAMSTLVDETIKTVRRLATDLRPSILDDLGLLPAMEWLARQFAARSGIQVTVTTHGPSPEVKDTERVTALFRIFQEVLTNVARHAGASSVTAVLEEQNGCVVLDIHDDGRGISREEANRHDSLGLLGMHERASMLGGLFAITGTPGRGTRVRVVLPPIDRATRCSTPP